MENQEKTKQEPASTLRCIGLLNRNFKQYSERELEPYGLTNGLYLYLLYVSHFPGCSLVNLRDGLGADKAYVTRAVAKLCDLGYIKKEQREGDGRSYCLFLTERGEEQMAVIRHLPQIWNQAAESCLDPEERASLNRLLNKVCDNLPFHLLTGFFGQEDKLTHLP